MTASTPPSARIPQDPPAWYDEADAPTARHRPVDTAVPVPAPKAPAARRTVSARVAAAIGVVAFLLGAGLSMLTGPLLGQGPGGPGGPDGAPGTSQQSGTGSTSSGTTSSGTTGSSSSSGT